MTGLSTFASRKTLKKSFGRWLRWMIWKNKGSLYLLLMSLCFQISNKTHSLRNKDKFGFDEQY